MTSKNVDNAEGSLNRWRVTGWSAAGALLLAPLVAMRFSPEVSWGVEDFVIFGILLGGVGAIFELAVRKSGDRAFRAGSGLALLGIFLLVWVNGAVGLIGSPDNAANAGYFGVLAVGLIGAFLARFRPAGLARTLLTMALVQALVPVLAFLTLGSGSGFPGTTDLAAVFGLNGFFVLLFVLAALLFRRAAGPLDRKSLT